MKRLVLLSAALGAAFACAAKDVTVELDPASPKRAFFSHGVIPVGYMDTPRPGEEAEALACRRAGAWIFHTSACDDATLAFLDRYGMRMVLVLDGDLKTVVGTLTRVLKSEHAKVLAGVQFGWDPTGGEDLGKWRSALAAVTRAKLKCPIALPVKDFDSPIIKRMLGYLGPVTHLAVDLRDTPAPFEKLKRLSVMLERSPDASLRKLKLWALAPALLPGAPKEKLSSPETLAWQTHWFMTAFAVEKVEAVYFDRPYLPDDFGYMLRHLWATATRTQNLIAAGESAAIVKVETVETQKKRVTTEEDLSLTSADTLNVGQLAAILSAGTPLTACAKVADGRLGDLQYLALFANPDPGEEEGSGGRMCLLLVNTTGEKVKVNVRLNTRYGGSGNGFRRRFVPDEKTGKMSASLRERFGGLSEELEPGEVTFVSFRM